MLKSSEATSLLYLARDHYEGRRCILDAGAYLCSSVWALAHGVRERGPEIVEDFEVSRQTWRHHGNEEARRLLARILERRGEMPDDPHWGLYVAGVRRLLE
jgi:hypothetical protein